MSERNGYTQLPGWESEDLGGYAGGRVVTIGQ
jgi:hypothetical protein